MILRTSAVNPQQWIVHAAIMAAIVGLFLQQQPWLGSLGDEEEVGRGDGGGHDIIMLCYVNVYMYLHNPRYYNSST